MRQGRERKKRQRTSIFFLSAEGRNKTETLYFKSFCSPRIIVRVVKGNDTDPQRMVEHLLKEMKEAGFDPELGDMAVCLVDADLDSGKDKQIKKADKLACEMHAMVIVSNPCFEVWFLCHYGFSTAQFGSNNEVISKLKTFLPQYSKSYPNMAIELETLVDEAIKNAKKLEKYCLNNGKKLHRSEFSPSTEVYKVIEALRIQR